MKVLVTGKSGFVGKHVVKCLLDRGIELSNDFTDRPAAVIHLAWGGLPNYENASHLEHAQWQCDLLDAMLADEIKNITVAGTCLETVAIPPAYGMAKTFVREFLMSKLPRAKWVRLWYLHGPGQRRECLVPSLAEAMNRGDEVFKVIDGSRDFMDVREVAARLVDVALQTEVNGIMDCCTGNAVPVAEFCRQFVGDHPIRIEPGYPIPWYEPKVFSGNPSKISLVHEHHPAS